MEATTRQLNYIKVLARRAGKDIDEEQVEGLSKEEASRTIDNLQEEAGTERQSSGETEQSTEVSNPMFGLAAKLVWQRHLATDTPVEKQQFESDVIHVYKLLHEIKGTLKRKLDTRGR